MEEKIDILCQTPDIKPKKAVHSLVKYIKEATGLSMGEFCEKELKSDYKAFNWRLKNNSLYPDEIVYMLWRTKRTVQELFGKDWHQLILDNSSGPVVAEVKEIMEKMTKAETRELERLMGVEQYKARAKERHTRKPTKSDTDVTKHPLPLDQATPKPPKDEPQAPETKPEDPPLNNLKDIFKDTYGTE